MSASAVASVDSHHRGHCPAGRGGEERRICLSPDRLVLSSSPGLGHRVPPASSMQQRWWSSRFVLSFFLLALVRPSSPPWTGGTAHAQLLPMATPNLPFTSTWVEQMAFDATNQTLYFTNRGRSTIVQVRMVASSAPATPLNGAMWKYVITAGRDNIAGYPGLRELPPTTAVFGYPTGVSGWPWIGVSPVDGFITTTPNDAAATWVGLWVCDHLNHAMRYINFRRGGNVTLVAGSPASILGFGSGGGVGAEVLLAYPRNVAWGRFRWMTILADPGSANVSTALISLPSPAAWTSVIYWTDWGGHCVRQGIPMHNVTRTALNGSFSSFDSSSASLADMALYVSTFAGKCGGTTFGTAVGWAYERAVLDYPFGIAVVNPFLLHAATKKRNSLTNSNRSSSITTSTVAFIGEERQRLSMIAPMYPSSARYLAVLLGGVTAVQGVTIGRVSSAPAGELVTASVDLYIGLSVPKYFNVSISLVFDATASTPTSMLRIASINGSNSSSRVLTVVGIQESIHLAMVPYALNSSYNGTMVVFSGYAPNTYGTGFQFYCCLGAEYADPALEVSGDVVWVGAALTASMTPSLMVSRSVGTTSTTLTPTMVKSRSVPAMATSTPRKMTYHTQQPLHSSARRRRPHSATATRMILGSPRHVPRRSRSNTMGKRSALTNISLPPDAAQFHPLLLGHAQGSDGLVMTVNGAGTATAVIVSSAASKAALPGRALHVWLCAFVGPSEAAADDPQQFLSFGAPIGASRDGGVRGAMVITAALQLCAFIMSAFVASRRMTTAP